MKIRTVDELLEKIADERVWRIRELAALRTQCIIKSSQVEAGKALRRSFVPLAYAHWEGFIKKTASYYMEFVAAQGFALGQLSAPFMAMYFWQEFGADLEKNKKASLLRICKSALNDQKRKVRLKHENFISSQNLDSKHLRHICEVLGLSYQEFRTKEMFVDRKLLGKRNHIAHGEHQDVEIEEIERIKAEVVYLIDVFRFEVEDAATRKKCQRPQATTLTAKNDS